MENAPLMINGKNVDQCNINELQQFARDNKIPFIGKPEPLLRGYIKMELRNKPELAAQQQVKPVAQVKPEAVVIKMTPPKKEAPKKKAEPKAQKPAQKKEQEVKAVKVKQEVEEEPARPARVKRAYTKPLTAKQIETLNNKPEVKKILKVDAKQHEKIWLLHKAGHSRKQIAALMQTLEGHVWNELDKYTYSKKRRDKAEAIKI